MRKIAVIASLICCLVLPDMAFAMPIASSDTVAKAGTWRMWPPQTSRAIWRLQVEPLVKHHKRGSISSSRRISGSGLSALVRGLTFTVEAGAARPNRRTAHRS